MMSQHSCMAGETFQQRIEPLLDRAAAYAFAIVTTERTQRTRFRKRR